MNRKPRICVVGSSMHDQVTWAPRLPDPGETLMGSHYSTGFGGKGANQAVMAARLGAEVTLVAKLGRDSIGELSLEHYASERIDTRHLYFDSTRPSGVALIWVDETTGQNRILVIAGANLGLTPAEVRQAEAAIRSCDVLLCQREVPMDCNIEAFRIAREGSPPHPLVLLNPAPGAPVSSDILRLVDVLAPNESEAAALTGIPVSNVAEAERAARCLRVQGARNVIITLGAQGALAVTETDEVIRVAAPVVKPVDTTGAGDCFIGSLAFFLSTGHSMHVAMERACIAASRSVMLPGTQTSFPARADLDPSWFTDGRASL